jgi:hypothetical protein
MAVFDMSKSVVGGDLVKAIFYFTASPGILTSGATTYDVGYLSVPGGPVTTKMHVTGTGFVFNGTVAPAYGTISSVSVTS